MTTADLALFLFNAVNCIRLLAYVPQLMKIARDRQLGALRRRASVDRDLRVAHRG
jgi:hypothetical protein